MSAGDPLTLLLRDLDRPTQPRPEFAEELLARLLGAAPRAAVAPPPSSHRPRRRRVALLAAAVLVLLAAVASAAYLVLHSPAPPIRPDGGQLTLPRITGGGNGPASIAAVSADGRLKTLWRCAPHGFCGSITSLAWSPDGTRVAFTLDEIGGLSAYIGLHIIDLATGKDIHIPGLPHASPTERQSDATFTKLRRQATRRLGCPFPTDVAWSPDSRWIAYACPWGLGISPGPSRIFVIRNDGSERRAVPTGVTTALSPTWSPDGSQIAFATARVPRGRTRSDTRDPYTEIRSAVYAVGLDGSHRRLLAREATAPSWSPDGSAIAYQSACHGIGLVSPAGEVLTPGAEPGVCAAIGPAGAPAWSPDGTQIAIESQAGLYVVHADGSRLDRVRGADGQQIFDTARPAWAPGVSPTRSLQQSSGFDGCRGPCA